MTKKSMGRQLRDAEAKKSEKEAKLVGDSPVWDDLNELQVSAKLLLQQHTTVVQLGRDKELIAHLEDPKNTVEHIKVLTNDIRTMHEQIQAVAAQHTDKSGPAKDTDELMQAIGLSQEYISIMEQHEGVLKRGVMEITEHFQTADNRRRVANGEEPIVQVSQAQMDAAKDLAEDAVMVEQPAAVAAEPAVEAQPE